MVDAEGSIFTRPQRVSFQASPTRRYRTGPQHRPRLVVGSLLERISCSYLRDAASGCLSGHGSSPPVPNGPTTPKPWRRSPPCTTARGRPPSRTSVGATLAVHPVRIVVLVGQT